MKRLIYCKQLFFVSDDTSGTDTSGDASGQSDDDDANDDKHRNYLNSVKNVSVFLFLLFVGLQLLTGHC